MKTITLSLLAGAVLAVCMPAAAAPLLANGSFELGSPLNTPVGNNGDVNSQRLWAGDSTTLTDWTVIGTPNTDIAWIGAGNPYGLTASEGNNFLDLTGWQAGGPAGKGVMQSITTVIGQQYTVSFDLGNSTNYNYGNANALNVTAGNLNQTVASVTNNSPDSWDSFTLSFVAQSSTTALVFTGVQATYYIGLDNVSVTAVPEPETYAMLLAGLGLMGVITRRRKASKA